MEFHELNKEERKLLLEILEIDTEKLKCRLCGRKVTYDRCGIFPPIDTEKNPTVLCDSLLCLSEYLGKVEKAESRRLMKDRMLSCPHCGRPFVHVTDVKTGRRSDYLWEPDCDCLGKKFQVSLG